MSKQVSRKAELQKIVDAGLHKKKPRRKVGTLVPRRTIADTDSAMIAGVVSEVHAEKTEELRGRTDDEVRIAVAELLYEAERIGKFDEAVRLLEALFDSGRPVTKAAISQIWRQLEPRLIKFDEL